MLVHYFQPNPALREYVRLFQIVHFVFDDSVVLPVKPYWPRPEHCLAFYTRHTETVRYVGNDTPLQKPRSALIGQPSIVTNRHVGREFLLFQVVFQPGALFRLTGLPVHELTNQFIDAEALWGPEIRLVNERLNSTDNYTDMTAIVELFIRVLIDTRSSRQSRYSIRPIDKVSQFMLTNPTPVERLGISPKLYSRIIRFDNAMKISNAQPGKDWLSIALEVGYHDYQHMARDFKEFTTLTPAEFSKQESQAPERAFGIIET
jgi:Helix-turn-helix domain